MLFRSLTEYSGSDYKIEELTVDVGDVDVSIKEPISSTYNQTEQAIESNQSILQIIIEWLGDFIRKFVNSIG